MSETEWRDSIDAFQMLEALWRLPHRDVAALKHQLHRYYLACCRSIWRLLPQEDSRRGVETGEQYLLGKVSDEELNRFNWYVEGAAFNIDYNCEPEAIARWVEQVRSIPEAALRAMLHPPGVALGIDARELLKQAAYFADYAMMYPHLTPGRTPPKGYAPLLSANLLREFVGDPLRWCGGDRA